MSSQNNDTTTTNNNNKENAARRRSSTALASMGNFDNEPVDRSSETVLTRKQKRANRRSTLRMQSEVAPFLGMDFDDEEHEVKETQKKGKKKEDEMKEDDSEKKDDKGEGEAEKEK
ncbi:hypothetical protein LB503_006286 [Fusarium chuoi]|nr:hypothetical protein LB503_006286 [Fusarium chuoi]